MEETAIWILEKQYLPIIIIFPTKNMINLIKISFTHKIL